MHLILSKRNPTNSNYTTKSGQLLYKVDKSRKVGTGTATIRKAVSTVHGVWQGDDSETQLTRVKSDPVSGKSSLEKNVPGAARRSVDEAFEDSDDEDEDRAGPRATSPFTLRSIFVHSSPRVSDSTAWTCPSVIISGRKDGHGTEGEWHI
jgi:hypothetical protein